ncbi:anthranilate synthase/aminodeoxychorismate synthase [Acididesulfobacillus acetoxydans]|uniref:aminodeoxychorismate synthase n=1 Tax=Acididesulfobacillus acetoxydans TaxID=1561005 RepID=A0A8S0WNA5_9FIRM|nr:aminodeoxychorismate synthase component I [Acididesulfobacillus acetoxydans]CAA7601174.1 anthranilate synthase/aminodeoxychorismate synthase [Acididesulfobacillus acetoxydans]CEJ08547.1 Anthranilate synthase component 1 [Acididesulfobacillus acetoxydans]
MIFILDNFDSFTYNLYQYFGQIGEEVTVRRRDICTLGEIEELRPDLIVLSPGPCTPNEAQLSLEVIRTFQGRIPILGVCLGHQAIGQALGGRVVRAHFPVHGKTSLIHHDGLGVFKGLPNPLQVTRYHSLVLQRSALPDILQVTAETEEGEIMAIRHRTLPLEGVQFHPEAILTEAGHKLLHNAASDARAWQRKAPPADRPTVWQIRPFASDLPPCRLLGAFRGAPLPFFLDSGEDYPDLGGYSFLGAFPFLQVTAHKDEVEIYRPESGERSLSLPPSKDALEVLDRFHAILRVPDQAPFPFAGGAVGFFSYDLKDALEDLAQKAVADLDLPLWSFAWYDGILVYDHGQNRYFLAACGMQEDGKCSRTLAASRLDRLTHLLENFRPGRGDDIQPDMPTAALAAARTVSAGVGKAHYLADLQKVIDYIFAGDIYQTNLSQRFSLPFDGDPWTLYRKLHRENPAPFAAFLPYAAFQILSSSPERFIRIDPGGEIETRPIKGTRPRGSSPSQDQALADELFHSAKDRAELTMIVDLERNDLGRICKFGSVHVPNLIRLEKYPTVWHLVSTIQGRLRENLSPSVIMRAIFPGGSITGAPKIRAMEIIEELEPFKRGIYTGSIGYLGFDGSWDLNIAIRTIVLSGRTAYLQAGGGIVADSVPAGEYEETLDKAAALFRALGGQLKAENWRTS